MLRQSPAATKPKQIAFANGACRLCFAKLIQVAQLAPTLLLAILDVRQPATLTAWGLFDAELPLAWDD